MSKKPLDARDLPDIDTKTSQGIDLPRLKANPTMRLRSDEIDPSEVRPLRDQLLVRIAEKSETKGGIILPKGDNQECVVCQVVRSSRGYYDETGRFWPLDFRDGEWLIATYAGERAEIGLDKYRFIREHGLWARVTIKDEKTLELTSLSPLNDRLLVEITSDGVTKGGIVLPENPGISYTRAKVVSVGPGARDWRTGELHPAGLDGGEKIIMLRYAGGNVSLDGKKYRLIQAHDVLGVEVE